MADEEDLYFFRQTLEESQKVLEDSTERAILLRRLAWRFPSERPFLLPQSSDIIDNEEGVNNFAGPSLTLAEGTRNRSAKWESHLTFEDISPWICGANTKGSHHPSEDPLLSLLKCPKKREEEGPASKKQTPDPVRFTFKPLATPSSLHKKEQPPLKEGPNTLKRNGLIKQEEPPPKESSFITGHDKLISDLQQHYGQKNIQKRLGSNRSSPLSSFKPPVIPKEDKNISPLVANALSAKKEDNNAEEDQHPLYKSIDPKMIELIKNEIMDHGAQVEWNDIAGLDFVKTMVQEIVVFPLMRPDIFTGLRGPPKGLLLFGPPGTGKTLIGKCIACQSKSTFFSISASSMTSKWVGEGEKMVRALFAVARVHQPSVVFIDEIDSLLTARSDTEHESSRRLKTEFLVQLDGASTTGEERILIVGATNRPQDLDEAARRRLVKRLYVPLPDAEARLKIIVNLLSSQSHIMSSSDIEEVSELADGYSGADMANLCKEAAMGPIRNLDYSKMESLSADDVRPIQKSDFVDALRQVKASVSNKDLDGYLEWNKTFGAGK